MTTSREADTSFGKYELLEKIGIGGMAEIFKARISGPAGFEKDLVIKRILPAYADNRAFIRMLVKEAKLTSVLQHPNIVQVYELGQVNAQYYIAMEFVEGDDLLGLLTACTKKKTHLDPSLVLYIVSEICKGLAYAHNATDRKGRELHIIHRDVSPSNVLVSIDGAVNKGIDVKGATRVAEALKTNTFVTNSNGVHGKGVRAEDAASTCAPAARPEKEGRE